MRSASRITAIALGAVLVLAACASYVRADRPTRMRAWWNDKIVHVIPGVSSNVVGVTHPAIAARVANPVYLDGADGYQEVDHVLGEAIPGVAGYSPYWNVIRVTDPDTGELVNYEFRSEDEILDAASLGGVELVDTGVVLLCQVVRE